MECVDIALAADSGYFCGLFVTACSIAKYASRDVELRFNILDGGIGDDDWRLLREKAAELHPHVSFNVIKVEERLFDSYPAWHGNKMAYARLLLPEMLPDTAWCVYCDVDFSWCRDIAELWREREDRYSMLVTLDGVASTFDTEEKWFREKGLPFDRKTYFCSGLCFMNLNAFREQCLIDKIYDFLERYPDAHYPDQNALNAVTFGRTKLVSQCWQRFPLALSQDDLDCGVVIHHAGEVPWKRMTRRQLLSDAMLVWHRLNAEFRGISVWQSLRTYFGVGQIVLHRFYSLAFRYQPTKGVLKLLISCILRHPQVYANYVQIARQKILPMCNVRITEEGAK